MITFFIAINHWNYIYIYTEWLQIAIIIPIITGSHRFQAAPDRTSALKVIQEAFRPGDGGPMDLMDGSDGSENGGKPQKMMFWTLGFLGYLHYSTLKWRICANSEPPIFWFFWALVSDWGPFMVTFRKWGMLCCWVKKHRDYQVLTRTQI